MDLENDTATELGRAQHRRCAMPRNLVEQTQSVQRFAITRRCPPDRCNKLRQVSTHDIRAICTRTHVMSKSVTHGVL
eukprot:2323082-Amphidinium_carterae.1